MMKRIVLTVIVSLCYFSVSCQTRVKDIGNGKIILNVMLDSSAASSKIVVNYRDNLWGNIPGIPKITAKDISGNYSFHIPISNDSKGLYVSITGVKSDILDYYRIVDFLAEAGDSITCSYFKGNWYFSGRGYEKYQCQYDVLKAKQYVPKDRSPIPEFNVNHKVTFLDSIYSNWHIGRFKIDIKSAYTSAQMAFNILEWYRDNLSDFAYSVIRANVLGETEAATTQILRASNTLIEGNFSDTINRIKVLDATSSIYSKRGKVDFDAVPDTVLTYSNGFLKYLTTMSDEASYNNLRNNFKGLLRDRLLTVFFLRNFDKQSKSAKWLQEDISTIKDENCRELLLPMVNSLSPGQPAYDFALRNSINQMVRLRDFKGKIIVMDFWFTGCGSCKILTEGMKPVVAHFENNSEVAFVGISIDGDFDQWKKSVKSGLYNNEGSIDLYTNGQKASHPIIKHYNIWGYPTLLLIDGEGKIITASPPRPGWAAPEKAKELILLIEGNLAK